MSIKYHVKKLEKKNDHLSILWKDNFKSKFHFMWLRDNCPTAIHPTVLHIYGFALIKNVC